METAALDTLFNIIGTSGVVFILLAYFLMQMGKIRSEKPAYSLLNLIGALLIMLSLVHKWNLPSAIMEVFWIAISAYGVLKAVKNTKREKENV